MKPLMRVSALVLIDETRTSQTPDGAIARSWAVPRLLRSPSGEAGCSRTVGRQPHSLGRPGGEIPHIVYHLDQHIPIPAIPTTGVFRAPGVDPARPAADRTHPARCRTAQSGAHQHRGVIRSGKGLSRGPALSAIAAYRPLVAVGGQSVRPV